MSIDMLDVREFEDDTVQKENQEKKDTVCSIAHMVSYFFFIIEMILTFLSVQM